MGNGSATPGRHREDGAREAALRRHLTRLERRVAKLEALAEAVQEAEIRDYTVYDEVPGEEWVAIDRDDVARVLAALAEIDRWNPWATVLERRLGDV